MSYVSFRDDGTIERRIGRRASVPDIPVTWLVPRTGTLLSRAPRAVPGHIDNVSLTGAAVIGPHDMGVRVGETLVLRWEGRDSSVTVRHVEPTEERGLTRYGVELKVVHPELTAFIARTVDRRRPADV